MHTIDSHDLISAQLFENFHRTDGGIAGEYEDTFSFLNRSAWPECQQVRTLIEEFYSRYPSHERAELRCKLQNQFDSAFFELFLHELLFRLGCEIVVHPSLPQTKLKPDFVGRFACGEKVILEAVVVTDLSNAERARKARLNGLYREINAKVNSPNFFVCLRKVTNAHLVPPSKDIVSFIQARVAELDWERMSAESQDGNPYALPQWTYVGKEGFEIEICAVPRSAETRGDPEIRTLGAFPGTARWGGSSPALKKSIRDKSTKYGAMTVPFVIAVNGISRWGVGRDDVLEALFDPNHEDGKRDGVWFGPKGPRNRRVSAVLLCKIPR
ncbi:MAG: hypothetical protein DME36_12005 [Verrucomicrobia bacterium]|nr:MAG: hypothetical protein DME36_12005 [Verrucomicrobiota bacterium]